MATKRYKTLIVETDGVDLDDPTEFALDTSDALQSYGGIIGIPENTTVSAGTLQLTNTSNSVQIFTGTTTGQILALPNATTLVVGMCYEVWNFSTQTISIRNFAGAEQAVLRANSRTQIMLRSNSSSAGVWALTYTLDNGNTFGTELIYVEDNSETSNNSTTTWATKLTLTMPAILASGDYLLTYQFHWRAANADRLAEFRITHHGSLLQSWEPFTSSSLDRPTANGFLKMTHTQDDDHDIELDFRVGGSGTTIYVSLARMFVWRIS